MSLEILHIIYTVDWIKTFCLTLLIAGGPFERVVSMQARRGCRRCVPLASAACLLAAGSLTNVPRSGNGRHLHKQLVHEAPGGFPRTMFQTYGYFSKSPKVSRLFRLVPCGFVTFGHFLTSCRLIVSDFHWCYLYFITTCVDFFSSRMQRFW